MPLLAISGLAVNWYFCAAVFRFCWCFWLAKLISVTAVIPADAVIAVACAVSIARLLSVIAVVSVAVAASNDDSCCCCWICLASSLGVTATAIVDTEYDRILSQLPPLVLPASLLVAAITLGQAKNRICVVDDVESTFARAVSDVNK